MLLKNLSRLPNGYNFFLLSLLLLCSKIIAGGEVRITNVNEFKNFVNDVNSGASDFNEITVLLDADLSLSGESFQPIGNIYTNYFLGVFDGKGHIISDLKIDSSSQHTGLFGYSYGLTIRNVVLDSSCSITSSYSVLIPFNAYVGGIIGHCSEECNIENNVNMADVTFSGDTDDHSLYIGGIAGELYSYASSYPSYVKNCANYGSVTHSGTSYDSYVGGIAGWLYSSNIYNCLNYGTIIHSGTTTYFHIGGIAGYSYYTYIENCVSAEKISSTKTSSIGSIVGYADSYTYINYCYYTSDLSEYDLYGDGTPESSSYALSYDNTTFELNGTVSVGSYTGTSLIGALNTYSGYYVLRVYSKWLLNKDSKTVTFTMDSRDSPITMDYQIIHLPSLPSRGSLMFRWYNNAEYTNPLESFEVAEDMKIYGRFEENTNNYTITFDTRKEDAYFAPITSQFGAAVSLPSKFVEGQCGVAFWETEYGDDLGLNLTMPAYNFTLYAVWKCTHLVTPGDFIEFANKVNSGKDDFDGITVLLDSDLSFSNKIFEPIGDGDYYNFRGTFDGQGHIISDLKIDSTSQHTGLFGYSRGLTIRNIVLDSSCSITNSYSDSYGVRVGGIIGYCYSSKKECIIENTVNMADVTFSGTGIVYLGGIVGYLGSYGYPAYVKNCANYGSVIHSGTSEDSRIGGIAGYLEGSIYNCLNYGTITRSGTTSNELYLGGITGVSDYAYIENCVSAGKISTQSTPSESYIGGIVGNIYSDTSINYCYYISDSSEFNLYGGGTPESSSYALSYDNTTFELSGTVSVRNYTGTSLINALNAYADYYVLRDYSKWLLNKEEKSVKFIINSRTSSVTMDYQVILLPSLGNEGNITFGGWYNNAKCTNPLESFEVTEDTKLYGRFEENTNNYTISFDTRKGDVYFAPITSQFGAAVSLPSKFVEERCGVAFWETEYGDDLGLNLAMPAYNFTLYAVWKCTHLVTLDDFIVFADKVNSGKDDFNGITVLLDADLSFSDKTLKPIGNYSNYFRGTFDGQGHIISDLKINSTYYYTGLFGYSYGLTIRNVVLDSSCSITSSYDVVGGIIGYCYSSKKECIIENSVNMADVTFNGTSSVYLGGIAGLLVSYSHDVYVKNCANYGSITHSGTSQYSRIGGIVGNLDDTNIYNCINYGTISHSGKTSTDLAVGGIVGQSLYAYIENCVGAGKITTQNTPSHSCIGSIVGDVSYKTSINNSYYTSDVGEYPINGSGSPTIDDETSQVEVNMTLVNKLNSYAPKSSSWNKWLLNTNNASVTFKVNDNAGFTVNSQIILLPDLVDNDERSFRGWHTDAMLSLLFTGNKVSAETTLYGMFCGSSNYTVTFDANGGNDLNEGEDKMVIECNGTYDALPTPTRKGYTFIGWFTERERGKKIRQGDANFNNHTLYAHWSANNYIVTFDANGGNAPSIAAIMVAFNSTYSTLPEAEKPGYVFMGWFTEQANGTKVTSETIVTIPNNHTLYAHWEEITNYVKVVFSTKGLTKSGAEEILKQYTKAEFTIDKYEVNELGKIIVIVKFTNKEDAEKFVDEINELCGDDDIKANFVFSYDESFSLKLYPTLLTIVMLLLL